MAISITENVSGLTKEKIGCLAAHLFLLSTRYLYLCTIEQKTVNTMPLQLCQRAVHFAMKSEDMDLADVECMLVSLVSQVNHMTMMLAL